MAQPTRMLLPTAALLLNLTPSAVHSAANNYTPISSNSDASIAVDPASIRLDDAASAVAWADVRIEARRRMRADNGRAFWIADMVWRLDCESRQATEVDTIFRKRTGEVIAQDRRGAANGIPIPAPVGSMNAAVLNYVCNQVLPRTKSTEESSVDSPATHDATVVATTRNSGTGFSVSSTGHVLTNNHVVRGCTEVSLTSSDGRVHAGRVIARDTRNDLALLLTEFRSRQVAGFRATPVRTGESVTALGFPFRGLLAQEVNVSVGIVSANAGLKNDISQLQISAPVQPGNSGGPLLDASGSVVGVVVAKLDALAVAMLTGDLPQNVNFAVKGELAQLFLRASGVEPRFAPASATTTTTADAVQEARSYTLMLECDATPDS